MTYKYYKGTAVPNDAIANSHATYNYIVITSREQASRGRRLAPTFAPGVAFCTSRNQESGVRSQE